MIWGKKITIGLGLPPYLEIFYNNITPSGFHSTLDWFSIIIPPLQGLLPDIEINANPEGMELL
jgi:hypothetical protein